MSPNDALGRYPLGTTLKIHPHTPPMPFGREYEVKIGQLRGQPPSWYLCGSDLEDDPSMEYIAKIYNGVD